MRSSILAALLLASACATAPAPAPAPVAAATPAPPPCDPGHAIVNATLWMQSAAEYQASAMQTYATARRMLDAALADPAWVGAAEETGNDPAQPPAVILDADETIVDNSKFEARAIVKHTTYDAKTWTEWVDEAGGGAVPGAKEFLDYAKSRGVTPFYITNRDHPQETSGTRKNLEKLGFPLDASVETLLLRGARPEWKSDKATRRAHVAASYRVLLVLGDDLNDFINARDKSVAERDAIIKETATRWGTTWFILPNPVYGSWERPFTSGGGTPCEQLQRKIDALEK